MFDILLPGCGGEIALSYLRNNTASDDQVKQLKDYLLLNYLEMMDDEFGLGSFEVADLRMLGLDPYEHGVLNWQSGEDKEEDMDRLLAERLLRKQEL